MNETLSPSEPKWSKYLTIGMLALIVVLLSVTAFSVAKPYMQAESMEDLGSSAQEIVLPSKTPKDYYNMFQCSCCGKPIDADCCGMAKQRKEYLNKLLVEELEEDEIVFRMVKKFGFNILMDPSREQEVRDYMKNQVTESSPKIEIEDPRYDFGTIRQEDGIVSTTFTIKNSGKSDLVIENMDSSCMCTTAKLVYKGEESPTFGMSMHGENPENFRLAIPPGETAQLNVYYDPMAHGKQKKKEERITREITIVSSDPVDFQKKVRIDLIQVQ